MNQRTDILNICLLMIAALLSCFGIFIATDVLVYQSFIAQVVKDLAALTVSWVTVTVDFIFKAFFLFDRIYLVHVNDPLLI